MQTTGKIREKMQRASAVMAILFAFGTMGHAHIQARPSYVNFGSQSVGSTTTWHRVTIINEGRDTITITGVSTSVAQFYYNGPSLPMDLEPGESLTCTVTFQPSAAKTYFATMDFTRSHGRAISVYLRGSGNDETSGNATVAPTIFSQPLSANIIAGQTATFNVAATGAAPLAYQWSKNGAAIGGANSSSYAAVAETTADNNAQFTATVSNAAGSATSNPAILTVTPSTLLLNSSASSLNFGSVSLPNTGTQSVTLTNAGNSTVTISNVTVSGAGFNGTGVSGLSLNPGQNTPLMATFTPAAPGNVTGNISVASNATNSPDSISLSGTGVVAGGIPYVALSWSPSVSTMVVGYNTYASQQTGGPYTRLTSAPVPGNAYNDTAVQSGQAYYFVITSVDSSNQESAFSVEVSALVP